MAKYVVYRSPNFRVTRDGQLLILRQLSLRGSQASVEVTLQGDEANRLEDTIDGIEGTAVDSITSIDITDHLLGDYF